MKKLISLLALFLLTSCAGAPVENVATPTNSTSGENTPQTIPSDYEDWTYEEDEEEQIDVTKEGVEVSFIEVTGFPTEGIMVGHWDDHDIKLNVTYSDSSTTSFPFKEKNIPIEHRHFLGEIGHHSLKINISGSQIEYSFDIVKNPDFHGYECTFMDLRGTAQLLQQTTVGYYATVTYTGVIPESRIVDDDNTQCFIGWDYPLKGIHQNMFFTAQFRDVEKRYYGDEIADQSKMIISSSKKDETNRALVYLGRVHCAAINYGDTIYHTVGNEEAPFTFTLLNPYGEKWNVLNDNIFNYGIHYGIDAKYSSYMYGEAGAFGVAPTILNGFESYYDVKSHTIALDNGQSVNTSIATSFDTCYDAALRNSKETMNLDKDAETGYYRIALTMSFDVYLSVSFTKLTENRYSLVPGSKFIFSPVTTTGKVRLEFSETYNFTQTISKSLNFSTGTLYNIANSLEW